MAASQATKDRVAREAVRAAQRNGINPQLFRRQIGAESNFDPTVGSSAGAQGAAELMPATAVALGVNLHDGRVSDDLAGAAHLMAGYLHQYGGSWSKALTAYNAGPGRVGKPLYSETAAYIQRILGGGGDVHGSAGDGGSGGVAATVTPASVQYGKQAISVPDPVLRRQQFFAQWLAQHDPDSPLVKLGAVDPNMSTTKDVTVPVATGMRGGIFQPTGGGGGTVVKPGNVVVAPGANRGGVGLAPILTNLVRDTAGHAKRTLTIGTGTNHNQMTVDGNVSDHWDGHAADIPMPVDSRQGDLTAAHALVAAGVPWGQALSMATRGGLFNVTPSSGPFKGHRVQVIWKTNQGGNHHNHVHIGIR